MGKWTACSSFVESDDVYPSKLFHIANYFYDYFVSKVSNLRQSMISTLNSSSELLINERIMRCKSCTFEFHSVDVVMVERLLSSLTQSKSNNINHLEGKMWESQPLTSTPCHIFQVSDWWHTSNVMEGSKNHSSSLRCKINFWWSQQ